MEKFVSVPSYFCEKWYGSTKNPVDTMSEMMKRV